jgi:nitrite transporter NirC
MTEHESAKKAVDVGVRKSQLLVTRFSHYVLRSVLAGLYLSLVVMVFWSLQQGLSSSPFGKVIASAFFGVGLCIIVFTEAELFTSNCFYLAMATFARQTSWKRAMLVLGVSWLGNFCGALLLAFIFYQSGCLTSLPADHALFSGAIHKVQQSFSVLFWKGVLANWVVCLAVWMALRLKEETAKMITMILVVFTFLYLGFEHSIANMGTFCFSLMSGGAFKVGDAVRNLACCTLGNFVGGALLVGWVYAVLGRVKTSNDIVSVSSSSSTLSTEPRTI